MRRMIFVLILIGMLPMTAHAYQDDKTCQAIVFLAGWSRPAPALEGTGGNGATYGILVNLGEEDDTLIAAQSEVANTVEIHEHVMEDGLMQMRPIEGGLTIPSGGYTVFEPGGYHMMLIDLTSDLLMDELYELTLVFENAGELTVTPVIQDEAPEVPSIYVLGDLSACEPFGFYGGVAHLIDEQVVIHGLLLNLTEDDYLITGVSTLLTENIEIPDTEMTVAAENFIRFDHETAIVLHDLETEAAIGDTIDLTFSFEDADDLTVSLTIQEETMLDLETMEEGMIDGGNHSH